MGMIISPASGPEANHPDGLFGSPSSSEAASASSHGLIEALESLYSWEDYAGVLRLLLQHPEAHGPLVQAAAVVPELFGPNTPLSLRVVRDVESDGPDTLRADIYTSKPPREALADLKAFDEFWWLDAMRTVQHRLSFGLRFA